MPKRTRLLIDPAVQWAMVRRVLIHWGLFLVCLVSLGALVRVLLEVGNEPFSSVWRSAILSQIPVIGVMLVMMPLFLRDTMKLSNRFAGPMFRLRTSLRGLATGHPRSPIKFREEDFWQEAASDFNQVLEQVERLQAENDSLRSQLAEQPEMCETP
ncbi:MAG: hypothetical protein P8L85_00440 [Rubripirellula sp.]|nr:hypothetical protein [Rubripirellula sp.]